jgi:hypothetical protein
MGSNKQIKQAGRQTNQPTKKQNKTENYTLLRLNQTKNKTKNYTLLRLNQS